MLHRRANVAKRELKCFVCGSDDEGKEKIVCTRCLPMLIHGAH